MPTFRQERLADEIIENMKRPPHERKNKKQMVVSVGYTPTTADVKAPEIMEQKGVKEALTQKGFSVEAAKRVVGEILEKGEKDENRLRAGDMIFKVHGTYAPEKRVDLQLKGTLEELARLGDAELLAMLDSDNQESHINKLAE